MKGTGHKVHNRGGRPRRPITVAASEGQRLLLEEPGQLRELAAACGLSIQILSDYRGGLKRPSLEARAKLQAAFGIPPLDWTRRPDDGRGRRGTPTAAAPRAAVAAPRAVAELVDDADDDELDDDDQVEAPAAANGGSAPTALEDCVALLDAIRAERMQPDLMPGERVKLASAEARILKLRASLEQAAQLSEARFVLGHPAWLQLRRELVAALEPYPQAARAVLDALARLEAAKAARS